MKFLNYHNCIHNNNNKIIFIIFIYKIIFIKLYDLKYNVDNNNYNIIMIIIIIISSSSSSSIVIIDIVK